jgi:hypothetical protein
MILCRLCTKGQKFVRIRLDEKFLNAFKTKIHMHKLRKLSQDKMQKINFHFIAENP